MRKGFTLIELLIVIGIIAILAALTFVAVDPATRFAEARNAERWSAANSVLNAVLKYQVDNDGTMPTALDAVAGSSQVLGTAATGCDTTCTADTTVAACVDLSTDLVSKYLASMPQDPSTGAATNTDYYINVDANGRLVVGACDPELSETITVSR
ncbi:MAG: type II secretion system protein [Candidatus Komeilibacteria bacterium]